MKKIAVSIALTGLLTSSCSHMDAGKRGFYMTAGGASLGYGIGSAIDSQNDSKDKNTKATQYLWMGLFALGGAAINAYFLGDGATSTELDLARAEAQKFRELNKNYAVSNEESFYLPPTRYEDRCSDSDEVVAICSWNDGSYTDCAEQADFFYLGPKFAVKIVGFFSKNGCFAPPYITDEKFKSVFSNEIKQLERMTK